MTITQPTAGTFGQDMAKARRERDELDPADFTFCAEYYVGPSEEIADAFAREDWPEDCQLTRDDLGRCAHCGTNHFYGVVFKDRRDASYVTIGNVCADKFFHHKSRKDYLVAKATREAQEAASKAEGLRKAEEFLTGRDDLRAALETEHYIIRDIHAKLFRWGSISDNQIALVFKIAKEEAERVPEPEPVNIPDEVLTGRVKLTGLVLGIKCVESEWGCQTKVLVRDDRGFKVWGTYPTTGDSYDKGARISFVARVERSKDDPAFGFFSRPTKGELLAPAPEADPAEKKWEKLVNPTA